MTDTTFVAYSNATPITADWLNDVNLTEYHLLGNTGTPPATKADILSNIGAAALHGNAANTFSVAAGVASTDAVNLSQADNKYAALHGNAANTFSVAAGVASTDAVNMGQFSFYGSSNGYQKFPGGLIIQWGAQYVPATTTGTYSFPITFPNGVLQFVAGMDIDGPGSYVRNDSTGGRVISLSQYQLRQGSSYGGMTIHWVCFGG
jgi:hypothetical protein